MNQPTRICSIDDCSKPTAARDMCITHYSRWWRTGDPGAGRPVKQDTRGMTAEQRYEMFADKSGGPGACWPWTGPTDTQFGYGLIALGGKRRMGVHRWICGVARGYPLGPDEEAMHSCDVPICCNPAHLTAGTHLENVMDMHNKGRFTAWQSLKTHCKRGHELSGDNLRIDAKGMRQCRECLRTKAREAARIKAAERRATQPPPVPQTHCKRGHLLSGENLYMKAGRRVCRTCSAMHQAEYQKRKRAAAS